MIVPLYLDTSAAVKLIFRNERGADALSYFLTRVGSGENSYSFHASSILLVEMESVIRRKLAETGKTIHDFSEEMRAWNEYGLRHFQFLRIDDGVIATARNLLRDTRIPGRLRSLDAIHLATCSIFGERFPGTIFLVSDTALIAAARSINLSVFDPENP